MKTLFDVPARLATWAGGIDSLKSIPGLLKHLQIRAQVHLIVFHLIVSIAHCLLKARVASSSCFSPLSKIGYGSCTNDIPIAL
jgi:hypothetical protein